MTDDDPLKPAAPAPAPGNVPAPTAEDREVNLGHAYKCSHLLPDPGGEVCRRLVRRLAATEAALAASREEAARLREMLREIVEYHRKTGELTGGMLRRAAALLTAQNHKE